MYPHISAGSIVRVHEASILQDGQNFMAINKYQEEFLISRSISRVLYDCTGLKSISEMQKAYGSEVNEVIAKLEEFGVISLSAEPAMNASHDLQFRSTKTKVPCKTALWHATRKCNLSCQHCYYLYDNDKREFHIESVDVIVKQLLDLGVEMVILSGGEILSNRNLFLHIISYLTKFCIPFRINTNGTMGKEIIAEAIADNPYSRCVQVSIDGSEETHDKFRGAPGSFSKTMSSVKFFSQKNIFVKVVSMLTDAWLAEDYITLFAKKLSNLGVDTWVIEIPSVTGRWESSYSQKYVNRLITVARSLLLWCESEDHNFTRVSFSQVFEWPPQQRSQKTLDDYICSHDLGLLTFGIEGVSYCSLFRESFGSDWKDFESPYKLFEAWEKISQFRVSKTIRDNDSCNTCDLFSFCQGGCPGQYTKPTEFTGCDLHSRLLALVKKGLLESSQNNSLANQSV